MDTMVGVEKTALAEMTRAAFAVSAYNNAAVIAFNEKHGANPPINIIHDELAFRLYPFLKNAYVKTADLESTVICICRLKEIIKHSDLFAGLAFQEIKRQLELTSTLKKNSVGIYDVFFRNSIFYENGKHFKVTRPYLFKN